MAEEWKILYSRRPSARFFQTNFELHCLPNLQAGPLPRGIGDQISQQDTPRGVFRVVQQMDSSSGEDCDSNRTGSPRIVYSWTPRPFRILAVCPSNPCCPSVVSGASPRNY